MKKGLMIAAAALAAALLAACGGGSKSSSDTASATVGESEPQAAYYSEMGENTSASYDMETGAYPDEPMAEEAPAEVEEAFDGGSVVSGTGIDNIGATGQKLIKTVRLEMETKEFDTLLEEIRGKVEDMGGYIESSDISGSSYYSAYATRYAYLTLRIPSDKLDGFVTVVSGLGNVINKSESVEDITLQYVDTESHKSALAAEQERLMELLEQAESMEDIIAIESRLSQVRYELQYYESTLRTYDNKVNYSTVTVNLNEVERETRAPEKKSFVEEIQYRLSNNLYSIGQGFRSFAVWFISSLPYLAMWAVVLFAAVCIGLRVIRKKHLFGKRRKQRKETEEDTDIKQ